VAARTDAKPRLKVTWVRSTIGHKAGARGTIRALGLRRLNQTVEVADTPEMRGMLRRVAFLVEVSEAGGDGTAPDEGSST
jgi:large subunit ribosomal protein L30